MVTMPFAALAEETGYFSSRRRRSAKSSACCASLKARAANIRFCSAPEVLFILCKRRRALSRRSTRVEFSAVGHLEKPSVISTVVIRFGIESKEGGDGGSARLLRSGWSAELAFGGGGPVG